MIVPIRPDERSPGPRGPERFWPTGGKGSQGRPDLVDMWVSCPRTSSSAASGRSGAARLTALTA